MRMSPESRGCGSAASAAVEKSNKKATRASIIRVPTEDDNISAHERVPRPTVVSRFKSVKSATRHYGDIDQNAAAATVPCSERRRRCSQVILTNQCLP